MELISFFGVDEMDVVLVELLEGGGSRDAIEHGELEGVE